MKLLSHILTDSLESRVTCPVMTVWCSGPGIHLSAGINVSCLVCYTHVCHAKNIIHGIKQQRQMMTMFVGSRMVKELCPQMT